MKIEVADLGLDKEKLDSGLIVRICEDVESKIRNFITERVGKRYLEELSITIIGEFVGDSIVFTVDVSFEAPKALELDYEKVVEEAVEEAFKNIELELKKHASSRSGEVEEYSKPKC